MDDDSVGQKLKETLWSGFYKAYTFFSGSIVGNAVISTGVSISNERSEDNENITRDIWLPTETRHADSEEIADDELYSLMDKIRELMDEKKNRLPSEDDTEMIEKLKQKITSIATGDSDMIVSQ
ncbi:hypothetical protein COV93_05755 [Candidatus Woesearchaeota archaeon CG11_big_fil_rev_8_21_14_0_20_43_8]|nr:MAG: hypothetical protein COV93_05755 [Candidatus Woesearchaeota archaeon CG11_big_fil_rev_8_21_14_0_20_43_8]